MENGWNLFNTNSATSTTSTTGGSEGQNGNFTWDIREHQYCCSGNNNNNTRNSFLHNQHIGAAATAATTSTTHAEASAVHALLFSHQGTSSSSNGHQYRSSAASSLYAGVGSQYYHPDPHLMCLKLGKRHYFEDATGPSLRHVAGFSISKRGKPYYGGCGSGGMVGPSTAGEVTVAIPATVPRCQVEGCQVALLNAKDYHRRHKVCELHSKAPKVVVHGLEQRFCQQCSRFHAVTEFDDSKRSCRRRLAGHNERRRKTYHHHDLSISRNNPSQGKFPYLLSPSGRALSLLSSRNESLISSPDLSSRCSAALSELIAENRAALFARQLIVDKDWPFQHHAIEDLNSNPLGSNQHHVFPEPNGWDRYNEAAGTNNVTLDLMQAPTSEFELLSMRGKSKEEEECSQLWSSFSGNSCS